MTDGEELARAGAVLAAGFARLFVLVGVKVVVVHMLGVILALRSASVVVDATVRDKVPACL